MGKIVWGLGLVAVLAACPATVTSNAGYDSGATACTPGATVPCACADGVVAAQTCLSVGAYGACACPTPVVDAGPPPVDVPVPSFDVQIPGSDVYVPPRDVPPPPVDVPLVMCTATRAVDLLVMIDNSNSMSANQANLARTFGVLITQLTSPPTDPTTGQPVRPPLANLHLGVVSSDLGTPGSTVPSCTNSDLGDDGLLNPIRNGLAIRTHEPWTTTPAGVRPARCLNLPSQYPSFLTFDAATTDPAAFRDDFVCNAYLSIAGCGLEQPLESAYRALVVHNPREMAGNTDANAGFVRANAMLGVLFLTDEEDGSVRDCRYAEAGQPCTDAIGVFDSTSAAWASTDLNLRFYLYRPGSAQDPTWSLDRYLDPARPDRGFTSLKPGAPRLVVFGAIAGVPINLPQTTAGRTDYRALLGTRADGSDAYTALSAEGPVSMRQANLDPACSTRVVPACRREGSSYDEAHPVCDPTVQYFAWPSRRIVQLAQRFDDTYQNGLVGSICRNDYTSFISAFAQQLSSRFCP